MARLSTHVLDLAAGKPAAGVDIELFKLNLSGGRAFVKATTTNADGRTDELLLWGERLEPGVYELVFHAAAYLKSQGYSLPDPPFLDEVVIRFGIADPQGHYHVPLLLSPFGYSTYRGS
ncbi:MAG: hydroxyisourate hydrolase [Thermaceae bacterium]|nr:hydroxyisourate hydrolase [Thermaceae bacterium]